MHTLIPLLLACFGVALSLTDPVLLTVKKVNIVMRTLMMPRQKTSHAHEFELNFSHWHS